MLMKKSYYFNLSAHFVYIYLFLFFILALNFKIYVCLNVTRLQITTCAKLKKKRIIMMYCKLLNIYPIICTAFLTEAEDCFYYWTQPIYYTLHTGSRKVLIYFFSDLSPGMVSGYFSALPYLFDYRTPKSTAASLFISTQFKIFFESILERVN